MSVAGNPHQPGSRLGAGLNFRPSLPGPQECFLRQLLGIVIVSRQVSQEPKHDHPMIANDLGKRRQIGVGSQQSTFTQEKTNGKEKR